MRALPFRTWYILALLGTAVAFSQLARLLVPLQPTPHYDTRALRAASVAITRGSAHWTDPAWQRALSTRLSALHVDVVITSSNGRVLYRHDTGLLAGSPTSTWTVVTTAGHPIGTVEVYARAEGQSDLQAALVLAAQLLILVLLLVGAGWLIGRTVLRPLAVMSHAARRIADGDLDVRMPTSRITEIAQVAAAFTAMGEGLRAARERQAALEQERTLFVSAVSHDLRTPLFALRSYLEGLEKGVATTPEKVATYLRVARAKADALEQLIADLFAYTRLEYLEQTIQEEAVDLGALLAMAVEGVQPQAEAKGVSVTLDGPAEPASMQGDAHLLTRAVANLLDNALRHTPDGGCIRVRWGRTDPNLVFAVEDTGSGIAPHDLPHVFTPLYRGEASRNRHTGGAGLGLAIARRIVQAHGGDLTAANRSGGGAVFTGTLPVQHPASPPADPVEESLTHTS